MTKHYCDICGKEITDWNNVSEYKIKKRVYSWHESWWEKLVVHNQCWSELISLINERRKINGNL